MYTVQATLLLHKHYMDDYVLYCDRLLSYRVFAPLINHVLLIVSEVLLNSLQRCKPYLRDATLRSTLPGYAFDKRNNWYSEAESLYAASALDVVSIPTS